MGAAKAALEQYPEKLKSLLKSAGTEPVLYNHDTHEGILMLAPLKGEDRIAVKARDEYNNVKPGPGIAWIYDAVRATAVMDDANQVADLIEALLKVDGVKIIKLKNRSAKPLFQGYRDFLLNLAFTLKDGTVHVCELQVHYRKIKLLGVELKSHETYEFFRSYFTGNMGAAAKMLHAVYKIQTLHWGYCRRMRAAVFETAPPEKRGDLIEAEQLAEATIFHVKEFARWQEMLRNSGEDLAVKRFGFRFIYPEDEKRIRECRQLEALSDSVLGEVADLMAQIGKLPLAMKIREAVLATYCSYSINPGICGCAMRNRHKRGGTKVGLGVGEAVLQIGILFCMQGKGKEAEYTFKEA